MKTAPDHRARPGAPLRCAPACKDCIEKFGFGDPVALEACIQAVTGGLA